MNDQHDDLTQRFEEHRPRLHGIASRVLGSPTAADDAVQTTWLRLRGTDTEPANIGGWLTTVVSRVAIDMLRAGQVRDHDDLDDRAIASPTTALDPAEEAELADSVGAALWVVLDTLSPAERLAFVLHESFDISYVEIGTILGRSTAATKQLAHRSRKKIRGHDEPPSMDVTRRQRGVVDAFLDASRTGNLAGLVALLDTSVELAADDRAVAMGSAKTVQGAAEVAKVFSGRALAAQPAVVDGAIGVVWAVDGTVRVVWDFAIDDDTITHIDMLADPDTLARTELELL